MTWLSGLQVRPENPAVVHHALIYAMGPDSAQPFVTEHGIGQPFDCGGGLAGGQRDPAILPDGIGSQHAGSLALVSQ